jgi:protein transport protein SEC61 subunit gamma and related proteins
MNVGEQVGKFFMDSKRIFRVSKKPTKEEYKRMGLIIGLGIIIIGIIGFLIQLFFQLVGLGV